MNKKTAAVIGIAAVLLLAGVFCGAAAAASHSIFVDVIGFGSAEASPGDAAPGTEITLTCEPLKGFAFVGWEVSPATVKIENNRFIMPNAPVTVTAVFDVLSREIPADQDGSVQINEPAFPFSSETGSVSIVSASNIGGDKLTYTAWETDAMDVPERWDYSMMVISVIGIDAVLKDGSKPSVLTADVTLPDPALRNYVCLKQYTNGEWKVVTPETAGGSALGESTFRYQFSLPSYGPIAVVTEVPILPETEEPAAETPAVTPTAEPSVPATEEPAAETPAVTPGAESATPQPTQAKSPAPVMGMIAGLGAAALVFSLRRR